jgi:amino acid transporter
MAGLFACTGFEYVSVPAGETKNPARAVPLALLGSLAGSILLYAVIQAVAVGTTPELASARPALVVAARHIAGPAGAMVITVGALVSTFGFCSGSAMVGPRFLAAFADDGMAPSVLARRTAGGSPAVAVVVYSVAAALLGNLGDFNRLADISNIAVVGQYLPTCAAVLVLRARARRRGDIVRGFRLPLGPVIPLAAIAGCYVLLTQVSRAEAIAAGAVLAVGFLLRLAVLVGKRMRAPAG